MKRVVSASLITLLMLLIVAAGFLYFRNFKNESGEPVKAIPADYAFYLIYDPAEMPVEKLLDEGPWKRLQVFPAFSDLKESISKVRELGSESEEFNDFFTSGKIIISAHVTSATHFDFLYLKSVGNDYDGNSIDKLLRSISGTDRTPATRNYDGHTIRELPVANGKTLTYAISQGIFISSFTSFIVEDALRQLKVGRNSDAQYKNIQNEIESTGLDLYINFKKLSSFTGIFTDDVKHSGIDNFKSYAGLSGCSIKPDDELLSFKGVLSYEDSSSYQLCFSSQEPVELNLLSILPENTAFLNYTAVSNFRAFYEHFTGYYFSRAQKELKSKVIARTSENYDVDIERLLMSFIGNEFAYVITEPSGIKYDNNCFAIFRVSDPEKAVTELESISQKVDSKGNFFTMKEDYNGSAIRLVRLNGIIPALFGDIFSRVNGMFYTVIGDYVVFANQASSVRSFIDSYKRKSLLVSGYRMNTILKALPSKGNHMIYIQPQYAFYIFKARAGGEWKSITDKYRDNILNAGSFTYLMSAGKPVNWFNALLSFQSTDTRKGITSLFTIDTDSSVSKRPTLTTDPANGTRQIIFQDDSGTLFFCDNAGNVIWEQELNGTVMGTIHVIDLFKNNSRQFLFNTSEYMYLIDVNGKPVGNYPIRLPAPAAAGISVLNFDGNKEPRIYVPCDNKTVYAYLPSGKPLPGWIFRELSGNVTTPVRKVSLEGRSYLFFGDELGNIFLNKSFGETGIPINGRAIIGKNTTVSEDEDGNIVFTDYRGNIIHINPQGNLTSVPLNAFDENHGFLLTDVDDDGIKDYVFLNRNELLVYNLNLVLIYRKDFEYSMNGISLLELGTGEKVFAVRSEEAGQTWVYNLKGELLEGFPVKGCGKPLMDELNPGGEKHLLIGNTDNRLYIYSVK